MNKKFFVPIGLLSVLAIAGCASYSGSNLTIGQSTVAEVEATMGVPSDKLAGPNGETIWQYPRGPGGRQTYAVRIGIDSVVKEVKQLLTVDNVSRIVIKQSTRDEVKALIGRPNHVSSFSTQPREVWEYAIYQDTSPRMLYVQFAPDGKVGEVQIVEDPSVVTMGGSGPN